MTEVRLFLVLLAFTVLLGLGLLDELIGEMR